jgi:hypothetical protein
MTQIEFAVSFLNAVQKKHKDYFEQSKVNIMKCVRIKGEKRITVHVIKDDLPAEIQHDIELMFWQD